jgi:EpsI family protein
MSKNHGATASDKQRRAVAVSAVLASVVMLVSGIGYRVLAARPPGAANAVPLDPALLERFPMQLGDWTGQDIPMDEAIVDATGSDAHVNRQYSQRDGLAGVSLFIACGTNVNEIMSHRPTGCYRAAGWQLVDRRLLDLPFDGGMKIPCVLYKFHRPGLEAKTVVVLHYCFADGAYFNETVKVRAAGWRGFKRIGLVAQVQITTPDATLTTDSAVRAVSAFAADSAPAIADLLEQLTNSLSSTE